MFLAYSTQQRQKIGGKLPELTSRMILIYAFLVFFLSCSNVFAGAGISIFNADSAGEGLNDGSFALPVEGNPGTTVGAQRLYVFQAAANQWAAYLDNARPITIYTQMNPLTCGLFSGVLGAAGATTAARDFPNAPRAATFYPIALAQELSAQELVTYPEVTAEFNSNLGVGNCLSGLSWWYGIGGVQPSNTISFYDTVLHEIAHGLGFYTFVDENGAKLTTGTAQWNDHYMVHLMDNSTRKLWTEMTDPERAASSINNQLVWNGSAVTGAGAVINVGKTSSGHVRMYAPAVYQQGSSISHWDVSLSPDELMEPSSTLTSLDILSKKLLCDIGWPAPGCGGLVVSEPEEPVESKSPFLFRMLDILLPAINSASSEE